MKSRKCANPACRSEFTPAFSTTQKVCKWQCGLAIKDQNHDKARKAIASQERVEHRVAKEKVKTRSKWLSETQAVINRYVRLRDYHLGCISCEKPASWPGQWHCSHFRSVGAAPHLRFNLWNMNRSCSICNNHLSGNIGAYKPALIEKIGQDKVDWLESNHARAGHDIEYLKRLKRIFSKKCRILEGRLSCNAV